MAECLKGQGFQAQIFLHTTGADTDGNTFMAILNQDIGDGLPLGLVMRLDKKQLSNWK